MTIDAAIMSFVAGHAEAWSSGDVDAIAEVMSLPQMLARSDGSTFIEDDAELVAWIDARLGDWKAYGVIAVTAAVETIEPLPDDAARVTTTWRLVDEAKNMVAAFASTDTLVSDDGDWSFVVTDLAGEEATWATAGTAGGPN